MTEVCRFVCDSHDIQVSSVYLTNIFTSVNLLNRVQKIVNNYYWMSKIWYVYLPVASRSVIQLRQVIDLQDTDKSKYFALTEFNNLFYHSVTNAITKRRKAWFHLCLSRILFAVKHSWTTSCMSSPLFVPAVICRSCGDLLANERGEQFASNDNFMYNPLHSEQVTCMQPVLSFLFASPSYWFCSFWCQVYRITSICLGTPPKTFDWEYSDKSKAYCKLSGVTPLQFYNVHVKPIYNPLDKVITAWLGRFTGGQGAGHGPLSAWDIFVKKYLWRHVFGGFIQLI